METKNKMFEEAFELKNSNKIDEAIEAFKKINIEFGDDKIATNMLAGLYYAEKDDAKSALPYAIKGVKLLPKSELASLCLFHCFHDLGKAEEAETEIKRYISLGGKIKDYKVLFDENNLSAEDFK